MPQNTKDAEVRRRAGKIAARLRRRAEAPGGGAERLLAIGRRCAARLKGAGLTSEHGDLYDEQGLPK